MGPSAPLIVNTVFSPSQFTNPPHLKIPLLSYTTFIIVPKGKVSPSKVGFKSAGNNTEALLKELILSHIYCCPADSFIINIPPKEIKRINLLIRFILADDYQFFNYCIPDGFHPAPVSSLRQMSDRKFHPAFRHGFKGLHTH